MHLNNLQVKLDKSENKQTEKHEAPLKKSWEANSGHEVYSRRKGKSQINYQFFYLKQLAKEDENEP